MKAVPPEGAELPAQSSGNPHSSESTDAQSDARGAPAATADPRLAKIVEAWATLPEGVREAVVRLVEGDAAEQT